MKVGFCAYFLEGGINQGLGICLAAHCQVLLISVLFPFKKACSTRTVEGLQVLHKPPSPGALADRAGD